MDNFAGHEGTHTQLRPVRDLPRVQPVEESLLRLVSVEEKVSISSRLAASLPRPIHPTRPQLSGGRLAASTATVWRLTKQTPPMVELVSCGERTDWPTLPTMSRRDVFTIYNRPVSMRHGCAASGVTARK